MISKMSPDNPKRREPLASQRRGERSFTLVETVVAVSLIAFLIVEISAVHGNAINFADYSRKALQASYLAKRVMSQVEYQSSWRSPLKELTTSEKDKTFEDTPDFTYNLTIEPLPHSLDLMFKIMSGGMLGGGGDEGDGEGDKGAGAMLEQIKGMVETAVGEDPIWMARVEVFWPEGARRSSVDLAMILTDIKKLETTLGPLLAKAPQAPPPPSPPPPPPPK